MAPAPYHDMYSVDDLPPVNRTEEELKPNHPLLRAWTQMRVSQSFTRDQVRNKVAPVYMGLIKELDDLLLNKPKCRLSGCTESGLYEFITCKLK